MPTEPGWYRDEMRNQANRETMDFTWAADVLNMDLTGRDPGPLSHVRVLPHNFPDEIVYDSPDGDHQYVAPPDAWDETTDTNRQWRIEIGFETITVLEAQLIAQAVSGFMRRRTTAGDVTVALTDNHSNL